MPFGDELTKGNRNTRGRSLQTLINLYRKIDVRKNATAAILEYQCLIAVTPDNIGIVADHDHGAVIAFNE